jgi:outer membrane protein insertion porin family
LRGFKYRSVGPKDKVGLPAFGIPPSGSPTGGGSYAMASAEYTFQVVEPLRLAVFYDVGFVNTNAWDFDYADYNDNIGFGIRLMVGGAPLSLDFGFPITSDGQNDDGMQFNFSFGTRF